MIELDNGSSIRLTARERWLVEEVGGKVAYSSARVRGGVVEVTALSSIQPMNNLEGLAESEVSRTERDLGFAVRRLKNRTVNGVLGFVLQGKGSGSRYYKFGAYVSDNQMTIISFRVSDDLEESIWIEPILDSLDWKR